MYLGHRVGYNNSNYMNPYQNLNLDWSWCGIVSKVLTKSVAAVWSRAIMYMTVVQTVFIYWSEVWAVMG